jgi:aminoglycoside phosphotransferase (APT) family kinase protein
VLAEIHAAEVAEVVVGHDAADAVPGMSDYARLHAVPLTAALGDELGARVLAFIDENERLLDDAAGAPVLLHGDFKASNLHWTHGSELLVLDWEFAWAGPRLMDVGQLLRWNPPAPFIDAFAAAYADHGGPLGSDWRRLAAWFDLFNLVGLAVGGTGVRRRSDLQRRIRQTLGTGHSP